MALEKTATGEAYLQSSIDCRRRDGAWTVAAGGIRAKPMESLRGVMERILALAVAGQISLPKAVKSPLISLAAARDASEKTCQGRKALLDFSGRLRSV
jgi:hypothetical protein